MFVINFALILCTIFLASLCVSGLEDEKVPSALLQAAHDGNFEKIEQALENGEDINITNEDGWTVASFAVNSGNPGLLRFVIEKGVDLNIQDSRGYTPLMMAASAVRKF